MSLNANANTPPPENQFEGYPQHLVIRMGCILEQMTLEMRSCFKAIITTPDLEHWADATLPRLVMQAGPHIDADYLHGIVAYTGPVIEYYEAGEGEFHLWPAEDVSIEQVVAELEFICREYRKPSGTWGMNDLDDE